MGSPRDGLTRWRQNADGPANEIAAAGGPGMICIALNHMTAARLSFRGLADPSAIPGCAGIVVRASRAEALAPMKIARVAGAAAVSLNSRNDSLGMDIVSYSTGVKGGSDATYA